MLRSVCNFTAKLRLWDQFGFSEESSAHFRSRVRLVFAAPFPALFAWRVWLRQQLLFPADQRETSAGGHVNARYHHLPQTPSPAPSTWGVSDSDKTKMLCYVQECKKLLVVLFSVSGNEAPEFVSTRPVGSTLGVRNVKKMHQSDLHVC